MGRECTILWPDRSQGGGRYLLDEGAPRVGVIAVRGIRLDPEGVELTVIHKMLPLAGKRLLEIGCGDGRLTQDLAERAASVVAIDPDRQAVARARRTLPRHLRGRVRFGVGRAESLPYADGTFDVAIFSWSL